MHNRRARPTLRLLREDLAADWRSPHVKRSLEEGDLIALHPLSGLPHPIIEKAAESFGPDPDCDSFVGSIHSSTKLPLLEIKQGQWRGGVWRDDQLGVCWLVVAGLAKGDQDRSPAETTNSSRTSGSRSLEERQSSISLLRGSLRCPRARWQQGCTGTRAGWPGLSGSRRRWPRSPPSTP